MTSAEKPDGIANQALTQALPAFSRALSLFMKFPLVSVGKSDHQRCRLYFRQSKKRHVRFGHSRHFRRFVLMSAIAPFATELRTSRNDALGQEETRALQQKPHRSITSSAIASSVGGTRAERLRGPEIDLGDRLKRGRLGA